LNKLTRAAAKVGNYAFTTLEPNLGAYYDLIIADIPGLIEGASVGKGLGAKFLRHIERTKEVFHLVSAESPDPLADYKTIRTELSAYDNNLAIKPEKVFLSKSDLLTSEEISAIIGKFEKEGIKAQPITTETESGLLPVRDALAMAAKKKSK
jgi:GTPase